MSYVYAMKNDFVIILPNIRSCHNVGAIFRTADAFRVGKLFLVGYTAHPPKPQIDKVSLGAETWIPWDKREELLPLITELKEEGYSIVALEEVEESMSLGEYQPKGPVALVLGNEVDGVSEDVLAQCDAIVHIPMLGKKRSLNVSVAAGVAMHAIRQKLDS